MSNNSSNHNKYTVNITKSDKEIVYFLIFMAYVNRELLS